MSAAGRNARRRWPRRLLRVVAGLLVLAVLAVLGLVWRLHRGPIRIDFLESRIEQALNELVAPASVELGETTLNWVAGKRPVQIRVTDVEVLNPAGDRLVGFDEIRVGLYKPALLRGRVIPTGLEVRRTSVVLKRNEDGLFELGLAQPAPSSEAEVSPGLPELLDQWVAPDDPSSPLGRLTAISIAESRVTVHDRMMGVDWGAERVDVSVKRQRSSLKARLSFSLELGDHTSSVVADATYETADRGVSASVRFEDLMPSSLAEVHSRLEPLSRVRIPITGQLEFAIADKAVQSLGFDLKGGKGELSIPEAYPDALLLDGLEIKGSAKKGLDRIELERVKIDLPDLTANARLSVSREGGSYRAKLDAALDRASVTQVAKYWPPVAGPDARIWVVEHVTKGTVSAVEFDMAVDVTLGESARFDVGSLTTRFRFTGLRVDALPPQAAITGADGSATLTADRIDFVIERARMRELEIGSSKVAVTNLSGAGPVDLSLDLDWAGPLETVTAMLSEPPLEFVPDELLKGLQGTATSNLVLGFPLVDEIDRESVRVSATGRFRKIVWEQGPLPLDLAITGGEIGLSLTGDAMDLQGQVELNGVPVNVELWRTFTDGDPQLRVVVHADTDDDGREALGLPDQPYLSGGVVVDLTYRGHPNGSASITAEAGLGRSVIRIPQIEWTKPAGEAGQVKVAAESTRPGAWKVEKFDIMAGELKTSGSLELTSEPFALRRLVVDRLESPGNDIRGSLSLDPHAGHRIQIIGDRLDAAPLIDYFKARAAPSPGESPVAEPADGAQGPGLDFDFQLNRMKIAEGANLRKMHARGSIDGNGLRKLDAGAEMRPAVLEHSEADPGTIAPADVATVRVTLAPDGTGRRLELETDNLGGFVAGFHLSTLLRGGRALLEATSTSSEAPLVGRFEAHDFELIEHPALAKVLELGSLRGMSSALTKEGLWFNELSADLSFQERRLDIRNGKALGHGFGITAEGTVDFKRREFDLAGAVTPMETIQRVIGRIPLLGRLLAGWNREGVIAVLYTVKGPVTEPEIKVDKRSILTPGITREVLKLAPAGDKKENKE